MGSLLWEGREATPLASLLVGSGVGAGGSEDRPVAKGAAPGTRQYVDEGRRTDEAMGLPRSWGPGMEQEAGQKKQGLFFT